MRDNILTGKCKHYALCVLLVFCLVGKLAVLESKAQISAGSSLREARLLLQEAEGELREIDDPRIHRELISSLAWNLVSLGNDSYALQLVLGLKKDGYRDAVLVQVASSQAQRKNFTGAIQTLYLTTPSSYDHRALGLKAIGVQQALSGNLAGATVSFEAAINEFFQGNDLTYVASFLSEVVNARIRGGDLDGARNTFERLVDFIRKNPNDRTPEMDRVLIAKSEANIGLFEEALRTASEIPKGDYRDFALSDILQAMVQEGERQRAELLITDIQRVDLQDWARLLLVTQSPPEQPLQLEFVNDIETGKIKVFAISSLAEQAALRGNHVEANRMFLLAKRVADNLDDNHQKSSALNLLARSQAGAGDWRTGWETAQDIESEEIRAHVTHSVMIEAGKRGEIAAGREIASREASSLIRAYIFIGLARGLIKKNNANKEFNQGHN